MVLAAVGAVIIDFESEGAALLLIFAAAGSFGRLCNEQIHQRDFRINGASTRHSPC